MRKLSGIIITVILAAAMLCGCAEAQDPVFGKDDPSITVKMGDTFTIKLGENPTTGYQWDYTISDASKLTIVNDEYVADAADADVVGAGGVRELTFRALAVGSAQIDMVYQRSFDPSPDDERVTFDVTIE